MDKISLIPLNFEKSSSFVKIAKNIELNDKNLSMQLKKSGQRRLRVETNAQVVKTSSELHTKITFEEIAEIVAKYRCPPAQAIFSAARSGDLKSVKKLIAFDVDIKIHGDHALANAACGSGNMSLIEYIIEGLKLSPSENTFFRNKIVFNYLLSKGYPCPKEALQTVLLGICSGSPSQSPTLPDIEIIKFIIEQGTDTTFLSKDTGAEILRRLFRILYPENMEVSAEIKKTTRELIELLLSYKIESNFRGAFFRCNRSMFFYNTPLLIAVACKDIDLVKHLIEAGADPNFSGMYYNYYNHGTRPHPDGGGQITPLSLAIQDNNFEIITFLLSKGATR